MRVTSTDSQPCLPDRSSRSAPSLRVTLVEAEACHFCRDALSVLEEFAARYPLDLLRLDVRDADGAALMQRHRAAMSPLITVNGAFFSQGRLPRGKFQQLLDRHMAEAEQ